MTLQRPTFVATRFREGYDAAEVDVAVDLILENLSLPLPRIDPQAIADLSFTPVRSQRGYDMGAVDAWLDEAAAELQRRTTPGAVVADTEAVSEAVPATEYPSLREGTPPMPGNEAPHLTDEAWYTPENEAALTPTTSTAIVEVPSSTPWLLIALAALIIFVGALAYSLR